MDRYNFSMSGCTCSFPRSTNFLRWVLQLSGHVMMQKEKWLILLQENIALVSACSDYLVLIHSACNNIFFCVVMMSPEVATSPPWRSLFENDKFKRNLVLKAVDEAHCICEWLVTQSFYHSLLWVRFIVHRGPSLRKAFQKVGTFWSLTKAPFMALSASAPPAFERTTFSSLALSDPVFVKLPLNLLGQSQVLV